MADYYTPTVIEPFIPLTAILPVERLFLAQVFDEEVDGESAYYSSNEGACDLIFLDCEKVRAALCPATSETSSLTKTLLDTYADEITGTQEIELDGCGDRWPDVLQDIVRRSPDLDNLTVTMAYTCSKMRPDGFGGFAMLITATAIRWESTHTIYDRFYKEAAANGEISHGDS
jgi:hypothetical protein